MAGPFIFISQSRIKEGKLDNFKRSLREMAEFVEANEPRVIAFEAYLNDDSTEVTGVQIHPDADSMAVHMQVAWEKIMEFDQYLDTPKRRGLRGDKRRCVGHDDADGRPVSWIGDGSARQDQSRGRVHPPRLICGREGLMGPSSRPGGA
jgi:hypothetical protein